MKDRWHFLSPGLWDRNVPEGQVGGGDAGSCRLHDEWPQMRWLLGSLQDGGIVKMGAGLRLWPSEEVVEGVQLEGVPKRQRMPAWVSDTDRVTNILLSQRRLSPLTLQPCASSVPTPQTHKSALRVATRGDLSETCGPWSLALAKARQTPLGFFCF